MDESTGVVFPCTSRLLAAVGCIYLALLKKLSGESSTAAQFCEAKVTKFRCRAQFGRGIRGQ